MCLSCALHVANVIQVHSEPACQRLLHLPAITQGMSAQGKSFAVLVGHTGPSGHGPLALFTKSLDSEGKAPKVLHTYDATQVRCSSGPCKTEGQGLAENMLVGARREAPVACLHALSRLRAVGHRQQPDILGACLSFCKSLL